MSEITIFTDDGVDLSARWWHSPDEASVAVVLVHGFSASKDHPEVVAVGEALASAGYNVLSYDARGHGKSGGACTLGDREQHDVAAAVSIARAHADRVVVVGASMGGIAVIRHAAGDPELDGVVAVSAPARWKLPRNLKAVAAAFLTRTRLGRFVAERLLGVRIDPTWTNPSSPEELVRTVTAPLAVVHGDRDTIVPIGEASRLTAGARTRTRLDLVRNMGHAYHPLGIPAILEAVSWALTPRPAVS